MKGQHDRIIDVVADRVSSNHFCRLHKTLEYQLRNWEYGEADLIALMDSYAFAFEVKTWHKERFEASARHQLKKDAIYIRETWGIDRVFGFYVHGVKNHSEYVYHVHRLI